MRTRTKLGLGVGAAVLLAAGAALFLLRPAPGFYRVSYDAIRLGMTLAEVERLVPTDQPPRLDESQYARSVAGCDWEGIVGGEVRSVHLAGTRTLKGNAAFEGAFFMSNHGRHLQGDPEMKQPVVFNIFRGDQPAVPGRAWDGPTDSLFVIFDADGRVIERAYIDIRAEPHWARKLRDAVGGLLPF